MGRKTTKPEYGGRIEESRHWEDTDSFVPTHVKPVKKEEDMTWRDFAGLWLIIFSTNLIAVLVAAIIVWAIWFR